MSLLHVAKAIVGRTILNSKIFRQNLQKSSQHYMSNSYTSVNVTRHSRVILRDTRGFVAFIQLGLKKIMIKDK